MSIGVHPRLFPGEICGFHSLGLLIFPLDKVAVMPAAGLSIGDLSALKSHAFQKGALIPGDYVLRIEISLTFLLFIPSVMMLMLFPEILFKNLKDLSMRPCFLLLIPLIARKFR